MTMVAFSLRMVRTDANGNLSDGVVGYSRDPYRDPELSTFGQFVFGESGEHVVFR